MNSSQLNTSFNSSAASSQMSAYEDVESTKVKNYVKDMLKSRIFLGRYLERRLMNQRIGYRDVVLVSAAEVDLIKDLLEAEHKLRKIYSDSHWIGITDANVLGVKTGTCLCTEIDNQPFGPFWFQIRSVKFKESEVLIAVKCLRHISEAFLELEPILTGSLLKTKHKYDTTLESSVATLNETSTDILETLKGALSIRNIKEFFSFIFVFIIAIFTGSTSFVNFLGTFVLALVRELSIFVKNSTPMFLGFLDFISKIVGGFYILVAMFFKPSNPVPTNKRSLTYYERSQRRANQYDDRSFD